MTESPLPTEEREQIRAGLSAALADPNCPVQFSPLLAAARRALRSDPSSTVETVNGEMREQHLDWIRAYVFSMTADNWADMKSRLEHQLSELTALDARASAPAGADGPKWRHKKRGSIVTEVARGFAQVAHHPIEEFTAVVIYRHDEDGRWWVRNAVEFDDGRFEPILAEESTK